MEDNRNTKNDMNTLIGNTLRIGVFTACIIALIGGIWYVVSTSGSALPDYKVFSKGDESYTTFEGIFKSVFALSAAGWVQLALIDFSIQRDWLYVVITGIVLLIIVMNSLVGVG